MTIPRTRPRPSCLMTVFKRLAGYAFNAVTSGMAAFALLYLYPILTPYVIDLFETLNTPTSGAWWGGFWVAVSFFLGAVISGGLGGVVELLRGRRAA
ncbi:MAG: hypothetical protein EPO32_09655 [Anaerolineae bacterium]|nr:MAG: hypothetical protein EPO32_09655 [Anaerolineae bacterium]